MVCKQVRIIGCPTRLLNTSGRVIATGVTIRILETPGVERLTGAGIYYGAAPHAEMVAGVVERNRAGFIPTGMDLIRDRARPKGWKLQRDPYLLETNVPGIFAAGDVRQGTVRRVAAAVGQGAVAVSLVHQYLRTV